VFEKTVSPPGLKTFGREVQKKALMIGNIAFLDHEKDGMPTRKEIARLGIKRTG
jgi:hypothetical protein